MVIVSARWMGPTAEWLSYSPPQPFAIVERALFGGGRGAAIRLIITLALTAFGHSVPLRGDDGYRQVQVIEATSGASGVTIRGFGMFSEFGDAVHGSTHTPASSMS